MRLSPIATLGVFVLPVSFAMVAGPATVQADPAKQPGASPDAQSGSPTGTQPGTATAAPDAHGAVSTGAPAAPPLDWKTGEQALLVDHLALTSRDRFIKAGESYFDHETPPRWVVFQAVPVPEKDAAGQAPEPDPFYSMYVARLRYDEKDSGRVTGIEPPVRISPPGSANTCGWFHPTQPWRILFGSTITAPQKNEKAGYQRGSSRYVWQFPDEMEVSERALSEILLSLPADHPLRPEIDRFQAIGDKYRERARALRQDGKKEEMLRASDDFLKELDQQCPTLRAVKNYTRAVPVFEQELYDAECSWSKDGRFVLYARAMPSKNPKPEVDIYVYDTRTQQHHAIVAQPGYDGGPFFSPNGRFICYRSDRAGNDLLQVYIAELKYDNDGVPIGITREKALTANEHVNWGPFWHPSGSLIVYATSQIGHDNYEVFAIEAAQDPEKPLWEKPAEKIRTRRVTSATGADVLPSFSEDGRCMMWTTQRGPKAEGEMKGSSQVWIARLTSAWSGSALTDKQLEAFFDGGDYVAPPSGSSESKGGGNEPGGK